MNKDLPQLITYNSIQPFEGKSITVNEKEALNIFPVKRIYWIKYFADEITYSEHAHKSLRQIIIAIEGKVDIQLKSIDETTYHFTLDDSSKGLYIPPSDERQQVLRTVMFPNDQKVTEINTDNIQLKKN